MAALAHVPLGDTVVRNYYYSDMQMANNKLWLPCIMHAVCGKLNLSGGRQKMMSNLNVFYLNLTKISHHTLVVIATTLEKGMT